MTAASEPRKKSIHWAWIMIPPMVLIATLLAIFGPHLARQITIRTLIANDAKVNFTNGTLYPYLHTIPYVRQLGLDVDCVGFVIGKQGSLRQLPHIIKGVRSLNTTLHIYQDNEMSTLQTELDLLQRENVYGYLAINKRLAVGELRMLGKIASLREVALNECEFDNEGLRYLVTLKHLDALCLDGSNLNDVGLKHLKGLSNLKYLSISNTQVSETAKDELQRALLGLNISDD